MEESITGSIETLGPAIDKYELGNYAADSPRKFMELLTLMNPRDAEILACFAFLKLRPTDLSKLFGKAGHRAEEDLHKAAHKLAGLIAYGPHPSLEQIAEILTRHGLQEFAGRWLAACIWQYAECRDFEAMAELIGHRGLRQHMQKVFRILHATSGREEGLLAGWLLWLVDGANPRGPGWKPRERQGRQYQLGPTIFRDPAGLSKEVMRPQEVIGAGDSSDEPGALPRDAGAIPRRATGRGGRGHRAATVKITRHMRFWMRKKHA